MARVRPAWILCVTLVLLLAASALAAGMSSGSVLGTSTAAGGDKCSWPELVGQDGNAAAQTIREERPDLDVVVMPYGSFGTADYRPGRVRIWLNAAGLVDRAPKCG